MRTRELKPSFFANEELARLPAHARLLFQGLWLMADREGRLRDAVKTIDGEVFPHERVNTARLLCQLADAGFIVRYEVDGRRYIWLPTFGRHQHVHPNERPSELPPFPDNVTTDSGNWSDSLPPITRRNPSSTSSTSSTSSLPDLQPSSTSSSPSLLASGAPNGAGSEALPFEPETRTRVTEAFLAELALAHQGVDVVREWQKAQDWLRENGRRKKDYRAFLRNWLRRAEDSAKVGRHTAGPNQGGNPDPTGIAAWQRYKAGED